MAEMTKEVQENKHVKPVPESKDLTPTYPEEKFQLSDGGTIRNPKANKVISHRPLSPALRYKRDKDREKVKGMFIFHEVPGGCMSFVYKAYEGDPVERYDFIDGQIYTIPMGVAKHLNQNLWYPEYSYVKSEGMFGAHNSMAGTTMKATRKVRRTSFQSLEFMDIEDVPTNVSKIVTMEAV